MVLGFCLWRSLEGEVNVTFPSRASGVGSDRRFFDFPRSVEGTAETEVLDHLILGEATRIGSLCERGPV